MLLQDALRFIIQSHKFTNAVAGYPQQGAFCRGIDIKLHHDVSTNALYCEAYFDYGHAGESTDDIIAKVSYNQGQFENLLVNYI